MPRLHDDRLPMIFASSPPLPRGCSNQWADQCADYGQSDALPEGIDRPVHHGAPQLVGPPTLSGALVSSGNFQHLELHFCGNCDGVWRYKRVIRDCSEQRQVRRAASVLSLRQRPHQLISGSVIATVTIIPHSAGEEAGRWDQSGKAAMSQVGARSHTDPGRRRSVAPAFGRSLYDAAFMTAPSGINPVSR